MTGKDYRKEWQEIQQRQKSLKAHVDQRLRELIEKYPDAYIDFNTTAKEISGKWIENMSPYGMIGYIEKIEQWSEEQQGVQQLRME